ncbi:MAG TPA: phage portal protein [Tepidisphaeraceae bacterium]|jgi:HK97 family phage portal protein
MNEPVYNLSLIPNGAGDFVAKTGAAPMVGASSYLMPFPLGAPYSDVFRKDRAPTPRELVQQLVGVAYACATLNADLVASTALKLYVATRPGDTKAKGHLHPQAVSRKTLARLHDDPALAEFVAGDVTIQQVTHHPILALLKAPQRDPDNPGLSGYDFRWMTQLYLESVGRAYWLVERDGLGIPGKLWLLRSHLVREVADPTGTRLIDHYEYGGSRGARYQPSEIIRFHFPDPENPYFGGYAPLAAAIEKIRIGRREDAHVNAMLENMGRPDAIWSPKGDAEGGGIGSAEAQRLRSAFRQTFNQAGRGGIFVSETPGTLQPLQWAPQDVVEIQRAAAIKTDICNVFGVPDAKLARNAANLASAKTADYAHKVDAGLPRCRRIEETLNARLVPMFDDTGRLFLAYDSPVPEDEVFALEQTRTASMSGAITRNEIRQSVGLDPVPWGEQPLVPNNMVEVDPVTGKPEHFEVNPVQRLADAQKSLLESQQKLAGAVEAMGKQLSDLLDLGEPAAPARNAVSQPERAAPGDADQSELPRSREEAKDNMKQAD